MSRRTTKGGKRGEGKAEGKEEEKKEEERKGGWGETLRSILVAGVLFLVLRAFVVQTFFISSGSMEDTLLVGDFLVVNRLAMGSRIPVVGLRIPGYSEPRRGDILVFDPAHTEEFKLVKRLVGMPGDTLEMRDGTLYVGGAAQDEPYLKHLPIEDQGDPWMEWQRDYLVSTVDRGEYRPTRDNWGPLVVPDERYFMLGDNREESLDSRYWGLIERWRIEGRVSFIYFSYDRESLAPFPFFTEIRWGRIGNGVD